MLQEVALAAATNGRPAGQPAPLLPLTPAVRRTGAPALYAGHGGPGTGVARSRCFIKSYDGHVPIQNTAVHGLCEAHLYPLSKGDCTAIEKCT